MSYGNMPDKKGKFVRPVVRCGPVVTKQSFGAVSDIRNILDRYRKTGVVDYVNKGSPAFMDVAALGDLHSTVNKVRAAEAAFQSLSPIVRTRFNNDSLLLMDFLADRGNKDEAIKLGLIPAPKEPVKKDEPKAKKEEPKAKKD